MKKNILFSGKRSLALILAVTLAAGAMTGCGAEKTDQSGAAGDTSMTENASGGTEYVEDTPFSDGACARMNRPAARKMPRQKIMRMKQNPLLAWS